MLLCPQNGFRILQDFNICSLKRNLKIDLIFSEVTLMFQYAQLCSGRKIPNSFTPIFFLLNDLVNVKRGTVKVKDTFGESSVGYLPPKKRKIK